MNILEPNRKFFGGNLSHSGNDLSFICQKTYVSYKYIDTLFLITRFSISTKVQKIRETYILGLSLFLKCEILCLFTYNIGLSYSSNKKMTSKDHFSFYRLRLRPQASILMVTSNIFNYYFSTSRLGCSLLSFRILNTPSILAPSSITILAHIISPTILAVFVK